MKINTKISEETIFYAIALTFVSGVGPVTARKLINHYGGTKEIFSESKLELKKLKILSDKSINSIKSKEIIEYTEKEIDFTNRNKIDVIYLNDERYPYRLKQCSDGPVVLFAKGNSGLNQLKSLAIVGTRNATSYGREKTKELVDSFKGEAIHIISGLASGIDSYAHQASLDNSIETIAVLGHGLNMIYPASNRKLASEIMKCGTLVTEFNSQLAPEKENFPRRNRIIAGMADAVLVVEANKRGGALITAEIATSYNRDVFAIPGRIGDTYSQGCNWLIKCNKAALVTNVEDIYYGMNWTMPGKEKKQKQISFILTEEEETIYQLLHKNGESSIDFICSVLGITLSKASSILLNMEMSDIIKSLPGKVYGLR